MLTSLLLMSALAAAPAPAPSVATDAATRGAVLPATPRFRRYGGAEGLPSGRTYAVVQDHQGYIWVGTGDGLARFDGQEFVLFRHDPGNLSSLPSNDISALLVDQGGRLWVGGESTGLNRLDPATGGFDHWQHSPDHPASLSGADVFGIAQTTDGSIWVGVYAGGVNRLLDDGTGFAHLRHREGDPDSLVSDNIVTLHADDAGRLWIGTDLGLDVRLADGSLRHVRFAGLEPDQAPWAWQIESSGGSLRVATNLGLYVVGDDLVARRMDVVADAKVSAYSSLRTEDGLWIALRGALHLIGDDGYHDVIPTRPLLPGGLPAQVVLNMTQDKEGGIWFATLDGGLLYLGPYWRDFSHFGHIPEQDASLAMSWVRALAIAPDGSLLVGGPEGQLDRLDPESGKVTHLADRVDVAPKSIVGVRPGKGQRLWIALDRGGVLVLDKAARHRVGVEEFRIGVHDLVVSPDGDAFASPSGQGVYRIDGDSLAVSAVKLVDDSSAEAETSQLQWLNGRLWRSSAGGLSVLASDGSGFHKVAGVAPGPVLAFAGDGDGIWLARATGLEQYLIHAEGDAFSAVRRRQVGADSGWPAVDINGMLVDARGRVWMTSRVGLWRFQPADGSMRRFGLADGLASAEFTGALARLENGVVFAGTMDGIVGFQPALVEDHPQAPQLLLARAEVRRDGQWVSLPLDDSQFALDWDDGELRVSAHALSYIDPQRNHFRFRMVGLDSDWVETGSRGEREFPTLPAGAYQLKIQAAGPSGVWQGLPAPIAVEVASPPWNTPLAWLLYALAAAALVWLVVANVRRRAEERFHLRAVEERQRHAEHASAAKTRFLATLGHEIRTPMTGVLGMAELLTHTELNTRQRKLVNSISHSGEVLLRQVNDALDLARIEAGRFALDRQAYDPIELVREVGTLHSSLAAAKGLSVAVDVGSRVPRQVLGDPVRVRQIVMNLVTNAVKFTEQGGVWLALHRRGTKLCFSVRDSGPGVAERDRKRLFQRFEQGEQGSGSSSGSGLGLAICRELVGLMDGTLDVESRLGEGSVFRVLLPLELAADAELATRPVAMQRAAPQRVLLVEDDPAIAEVLAGLLRNQGHDVRCADQVLAALSELGIEAADVLVIDIDLPDIDGFEFTRMVRQHDNPLVAKAKVLVVTARVEADDERRARAAGADGFLRKPVSGAQLAAAMADLVGG